MPTPSRQECLAAAIKAAMDEVNVGAQELADLVGVSKRTVDRWRSGEGVPDALQIRTVADRLSVEPMLFVDPPEPAPYPLEAYRLSPEEVANAAARLAQHDPAAGAAVVRLAPGKHPAQPRKRAVRTRH